MSPYLRSPYKRILDVVICIGALPVAFPLFLLGILFTGITSKGPLVFSQVRTGRTRQPFTLYKIRNL